MFYVKQDFGYAEMITEIHDDNVYNRCPDCGAEVQVDLAELFHDGEGDLESSAVLCAECTRVRMEEGR